MTMNKDALEIQDIINSSSNEIIKFENRIYNFYEQDAFTTSFCITNTTAEYENPTNTHNFALLIENKEGLSLVGNDTVFRFHGDLSYLGILNSKNIMVKGIKFESVTPNVAEFKVIRVEGKQVLIKIHENSRYKIKKDKLIWIINKGEFTRTIAQEYNKKTQIIKRVDNIFNNAVRATSVTENGEELVNLEFLEDVNLEENIIYQIRNDTRLENGFVIDNCENITLKENEINFMPGLGIVCQHSKDLFFDRLICEPDFKKELTVAAFADFIQCSTCYGKIEITNSRFSLNHDDVINIHGTFLRINKIINENEIIVQYMHPQTRGMMPFFKDEEIEAIDPLTFDNVFDGTVAKCSLIDKSSERLYKVTFKDKINDKLSIGDMVHNTTRVPAVLIQNNQFMSIPTRAILLSSANKAVIADNEFLNIYMSGILISSDCNSWYESGRVNDVTIERNIFKNVGNKCEHIISIYPENKLKGTVHKNIKIISNLFSNENKNILMAKSVDGLVYEHNNSIHKKVTFISCKNMQITT